MNSVRKSADVLAESAPYVSERDDADDILHFELLRIESACAHAASALTAAARKRDSTGLCTTWLAAREQLFAFPTAVMLIDAAADGAIDDTCWELLARLARLASPSLMRAVSRRTTDKLEQERRTVSIAESAAPRVRDMKIA